MPASGTYEWHVGQSTRPFVGEIPGQKEAYTLTCEQPDGTVLETLSLVIDRGQTATLNLGCGATSSKFADGATVGGSTTAAPGSVPTPSVNGVTVPVAVAAAKTTKKKPLTRAQRLANCTKTANKLNTAKKRGAARRSCTKRFGKVKKPAAKKP